MPVFITFLKVHLIYVGVDILCIFLLNKRILQSKISLMVVVNYRTMKLLQKKTQQITNQILIFLFCLKIFIHKILQGTA